MCHSVTHFRIIRITETLMDLAQVYIINFATQKMCHENSKCVTKNIKCVTI